MGASSSTFTAPPNPNINYCYDIFLNHRGPDVKETFARSLYLRLTEKGLRVFLDKEELQAGYYFPPQIKQAIKTAKVHLAIFSPGYAQSSWCLDELLMMLDSKAPIIPVFYLVSPADIRWTKGKYARELLNLSKKKTQKGKRRYDSKNIEKWRAALSLVADYKGFELEIRNGEELQLELLDKLVESLSETVKKVKKPDLYVAKYPTGLDMKLKHFEETVLLQQHQTGKSQILGIVGLGGAGKTTLAKEFFNRKKSNFHKFCFLADVRENAGRGSLTSLQGELLKSLTSIDVPIGSVDEGKGMLKHHLVGGKRMSKKHLKSSSTPENVDQVLIILDDVDNSDQVDALLPFDLSSGSLILITSRDKQVLIRSKVESSSIYNLTGLNDQDSLELFCSYAFSQTYPLPRFESLVDRFLKVCNGLPLPLKVFGANLYGRDTSYWEEQLGSFSSEINDSLKISYKALSQEEKQIFLDVACFFKGLDRDMAIGIWNESGWKGRWGFQNLQDKCLVDVDDSNVIQMHDQVIEMGRDVAENASPHRLWRWRDNVIDDRQSSVITARGIKMDLGEYNAYGVLLRHIDTSMLRIIDTEDKVLEAVLRRAELPSILWLRWVNCPYSSLPSWISMKKLRCLEVSGSVLNTLWDRERESQAPLQLPVFLEFLVINSCVKLKSVTGLDQLTKLRYLSVNECSELKELPSIETLVSLEKLFVKRCVKLKSIRGLASCTLLRILNVQGCSDLEELPNIEKLVSLEKLLAERCVKLKSIAGLERCTRLVHLVVRDCSDLEELPNMEALVSLEEFWADGCVKLKTIPELASCTRLVLLDVSDCSDIEELPNMEALVSLEEFWADGCVKLKTIPRLVGCKRLLKLNVSRCPDLEELPNMEALVSLQEFWANDCVKVKTIPELASCTRLVLLDVNACSDLEELPNMEALVSLEELWADRCVKLKTIPRLVGCKRLLKLNVSRCLDLEELPNMEALVSLQEFWANDCVKVKTIPGLASCTRLLKLDVSRCSDLEELPNMEALVSLQEFWADDCVKVKTIPGLAHLTKLRVLSVRGCSKLEETMESMKYLISVP